MILREFPSVSLSLYSVSLSLIHTPAQTGWRHVILPVFSDFFHLRSLRRAEKQGLEVAERARMAVESGRRRRGPGHGPGQRPPRGKQSGWHSTRGTRTLRPVAGRGAPAILAQAPGVLLCAQSARMAGVRASGESLSRKDSRAGAI